jgi:hypothetical protein
LFQFLLPPPGVVAPAPTAGLNDFATLWQSLPSITNRHPHPTLPQTSSAELEMPYPLDLEVHPPILHASITAGHAPNPIFDACFLILYESFFIFDASFLKNDACLFILHACILENDSCFLDLHACFSKNDAYFLIFGACKFQKEACAGDQNGWFLGNHALSPKRQAAFLLNPTLSPRRQAPCRCRNSPIGSGHCDRPDSDSRGIESISVGPRSGPAGDGVDEVNHLQVAGMPPEQEPEMRRDWASWNIG